MNRNLPFSVLLTMVSAFLFSSCAVRMPAPKLPKKTTPIVDANPVAAAPRKTAPGKVPVYLVADSLHTSLVVPYHWLVDHGYKAPHPVRFPQGPDRMVVMSWGDEVAYVQKRWLRPWEVFHALFMPSDSVTEFIPISWKVEDVCFQQRIYRGEIPASRGKVLAAFLNQSNIPNPDGRPKVIAKSTWGDGYLLDCKYSYYFPRICNVWTGQSLESCGLKINMRSAITANGLIRQVEKQGFVKVHDGVEGLGRTKPKQPHE